MPKYYGGTPIGKYCGFCSSPLVKVESASDMYSTIQKSGVIEYSPKWRPEKYKNGKMVLWHGSPLRFKDSILKFGILPRCSVPISEAELDRTAREIALKIKNKYGVMPSNDAIERAKYWARIRLEETKGCVYTSGDKQYAISNCLAGDEWIHTIVNYLIADLKDKGLLPKELNTAIASRQFYPDTKCALFELEVPVEEAKAIPENRHFFEVYEGKYEDPKIRSVFEGTDDFYRHVFATVVLPRVSPNYIKKVEIYERFSASGEHSTIEKEVERARELAIMRRRGVVEPVTWLDVATAFQEHYRKVKDALIKAVGDDNIERIKTYPAEPLEAYYKIYITLKNPVTAEFKLLDSDVLLFNGQPLPLYINEKAYTPYRLRLYKFFVPSEEAEKLQEKIEREKYVKITIKDFYVQVDNPAWYSRFEEKFVPRPGIFGFLIYE